MEKSTSHSSMFSAKDPSWPETHPFTNITSQKTGLPVHTPHFSTGFEEERLQSNSPCAEQSCDLETELFKAFQEAERFFRDINV